MAQTRPIPGNVFLSSYGQFNDAPEDEPYKGSVKKRDLAEEMEMNISTVIQIGHQLAVIGDECNMIHSRKLEGPLFHLAKGIVACVFQACSWKSLKSIMKCVGSSLNSGWRKMMMDHGWIVWVSLTSASWKWAIAILMASFMSWLIAHRLQNWF